MEFPSTWDPSNPNAVREYNRCKRFYKAGEEEKFTKIFEPSKFFNIFCLIAILYTVVSIIFTIAKRDAYKKTKSSVSLSLTFLIGSLINILTFYLRRVKYADFPCFINPFFLSIGLPLNLISSAGFIILYLRQCYTNGNIYSKHENEDKYKVSSGFQRFCMSITDRMILKFIMQYLCASLFYVTVLSAFSISYTMNPISYGFCSTLIEQIPQYIIIFLFIAVFIPFASREINKFRGNFSFGKTLIISMVVAIICSICYILFSSSKIYICSEISRYLPPDFFGILIFVSFTILHITFPLIKSYRTIKKVDDLEINIKGLLEVFDNEILYKDFFEYAVKKRSVEYAIFHVEYLEFKNLFKSNNTFIEEITSEPLLNPGEDPVNFKDKKFLQIMSAVYNKANDIYDKYFRSDSDLELNLPEKLIRTVTNNLYDFNINYNRYVVNGTEGNEIDFKLINCENIYDEVHKEAIDSLFLNVYSSFAKDKKKMFGYEVKTGSKNIVKTNQMASYSSRQV